LLSGWDWDRLGLDRVFTADFVEAGVGWVFDSSACGTSLVERSCWGEFCEVAPRPGGGVELCVVRSSDWDVEGFPGEAEGSIPACFIT